MLNIAFSSAMTMSWRTYRATAYFKKLPIYLTKYGYLTTKYAYLTSKIAYLIRKTAYLISKIAYLNAKNGYLKSVKHLIISKETIYNRLLKLLIIFLRS